MNFRIEVICVGDDGIEQRHEVMAFTKEPVTMETLGLTLTEGKELLETVQTYVVAQRAGAYESIRKSGRQPATEWKPGYRLRDPCQHWGLKPFATACKIRHLKEGGVFLFIPADDNGIFPAPSTSPSS